MVIKVITNDSVIFFHNSHSVIIIKYNCESESEIKV